MNKKLFKFGIDAREQISLGVDIINSAVAATLGPKGRNVVLEKDFTSPRITKDGVTVAKEVYLEDSFQNMGAQIIREVANRTNDDAGDGTTTSTVLAAAILKEGLKAVAAGMNPMDLKRGIDVAVEKVVEEIKKMARPVKNKEEIKQIGTISANGDEEIGGRLADAMDKIGRTGVITVEDGTGIGFELEVVEGMKFDRGYISPYFITNGVKNTCELTNPLIMVCEDKISGIQQIMPVLEYAVTKGRSFLLIADDVDNQALATMITNRIRGNFAIAAVRCPGYNDKKKDLVGDIATLVGAMVISEDQGIKLENVTAEECLGNAKRVVIDKDNTLIVNGAGSKKEIDKRCSNIRHHIKTEKKLPKWEKDRLNERLAKLTSGVAIIRVGGSSELEVKERKDRVDDALNATRAAVEEGVVPGGGAALFFISENLSKLKGANDDQQAGINIIKKVLEAPLRKIAENAGIDGAAVVSELARQTGTEIIFDAQTMTYVNAFEKGIIDPAKVIRCSIQNASSVAGLLITTEAIIVNKPIENDPTQPIKK